MGKERLIACVHYKAEDDCDLGKECEFWGHCQTCKTYKKTPGGKPIRVDLRAKKNEKFMKDKRNWE